MSLHPVVSFERVSKRFSGTAALSDVDLDLGPGEVHVLAGHNGAGKSTLIRILAGAIAEFQGTLRLEGTPVRFRDPRAANRAGVATIHQELSLVGAMTVADNLALGDEGAPWGLVSRPRREARAREVLATVGLEVEPAAVVERLALGTRQLVEIARALARNAKVVVMDEPTSALNDVEAGRLFEQLDVLRGRGVAVVFITHRMDEIYAVADRISVLRDGRLVVTAPAAELGRDALVHHLLGRARRAPVGATSASDAPRGGEPALAVRDLCLADTVGPPILDRVCLELRSGEIVGVTGLHGAGVDVLPSAIFGAVATTGTVAVDGEDVSRDGPRGRIARRMILLSGDRHESVVHNLSVAANVTLSSLDAVSRYGWIDRRAERRRAAFRRDRLHIDCPSLEAEAWQLSGGNQQKVAIARCLETRPRVLLLHEPSRGIDVGAKLDVHELVGELAAGGVAVLLVTTDFDELLALAHRVLVMHRGSVVLELSHPPFSRSTILAAAMGVAPSPLPAPEPSLDAGNPQRGNTP